MADLRKNAFLRPWISPHERCKYRYYLFETKIFGSFFLKIRA